jgi:hypothetical protein
MKMTGLPVIFSFQNQRRKGTFLEASLHETE